MKKGVRPADVHSMNISIRGFRYSNFVIATLDGKIYIRG